MALLDHLGVDWADVIGISAGATAALHMALRRADRVKHLVVLSGNLAADPNAVAPLGWARLFYNDLAMWVMNRFARPQAARQMGVPAGFPRDDAQAQVVDEMLDSIFPMAPRAAGGVFDAYVSTRRSTTSRLRSCRCRPCWCTPGTIRCARSAPPNKPPDASPAVGSSRSTRAGISASARPSEHASSSTRSSRCQPRCDSNAQRLGRSAVVAAIVKSADHCVLLSAGNTQG